MALEFAEWIQREWKVITKAPFTFVTFCLIAGGVGFAISAWHYSERISILESRISEQAERLGINTPDKTAYSRLTNQELKQSVEEFLKKFNEFAARADRTPQPTVVDEQERQELLRAKTDEDRRAISRRYWEQEGARYEAWINQRTVEYQRDYRAQAVVLRDEMKRRLPPDEKEKTERSVSYDFLAGPSPLQDIAADLQRLVRLLPEKQH